MYRFEFSRLKRRRDKFLEKGNQSITFKHSKIWTYPGLPRGAREDLTFLSAACGEQLAPRISDLVGGSKGPLSKGFICR